MIAGLLRQLDEMRYEADCLRRGRYPPFVAARNPNRRPQGRAGFRVPHDRSGRVRSPAALSGGERLSDCRLCYVSRSPDRYRRDPVTSVLLTIDDGRASVWIHALPLLRKYGQKAVVFLIPATFGKHRRSRRRSRMPGRGNPDRLPDRDPELMNWSEVEAAAASGLIDFQSQPYIIAAFRWAPRSWTTSIRRCRMRCSTCRLRSARKTSSVPRASRVCSACRSTRATR